MRSGIETCNSNKVAMGTWFIDEETPTGSCKSHHFSVKIVSTGSPKGVSYILCNSYCTQMTVGALVPIGI